MPEGWSGVDGWKESFFYPMMCGVLVGFICGMIGLASVWMRPDPKVHNYVCNPTCVEVTTTTGPP